MAKKLVVDFDCTLFHTDSFPHVGRQTFANRAVAWFVRRKKKQGWVIILNTMREKGKGLDEALAACRAFHIPIDYVNCNLDDEIKQYGDSRKIAATLSIDDTQVGLIGWLLRKFG